MTHDPASEETPAPASSSPPAAQPGITVVIATWNAAATLQAALDSIFEQTYPDIEVVVADGGSTDATVEILERNSDRIGWWASAPDNGIYDAWNKALAHASGDYICFLGADDVYHAPDVMEQVVAAIVADGGQHRILYGSVLFHRPDGRVWHNRSGAWGKRRQRRFRKGRMVPHPATFHHRSVFDELGGFDTSFRIAGDYEFLLRALAKEAPVRLDIVVVDMMAGGISTNPSLRVRQVREVYRARRMHGAARLPPWASPGHLIELTTTWWRWRGKPGLTGKPPR